MKRFFTILFLLAYAVLCFNKNLVIIDFYANRTELAAKYCINKDKPMLHCNGHCFLMRELKKEQQQEKNLGIEFSKTNYQICVNYFPIVDPTNYQLLLNKELKLLPRNSSILFQQYSFDLLKPPIFLLS